MNVGQLEELLAMLPKDMPVMVAAGAGCRHVDTVHKRDRRRIDDSDLMIGFRAVYDEHGRYPAHVTIEASHRAPLWMQAWADDVPYRLTGRWPLRPPRRRAS